MCYVWTIRNAASSVTSSSNVANDVALTAEEENDSYNKASQSWFGNFAEVVMSMCSTILRCLGGTSVLSLQFLSEYRAIW